MKEAHSMKFLEVATSSRSHRHMFYTRFPYDLSSFPVDEHKYITIKEDAPKPYIITKHIKGVDGWTFEDETAEQVMNRMIHD